MTSGRRRVGPCDHADGSGREPGLTGVLPNALEITVPILRGRSATPAGVDCSCDCCSGGDAPKALATGYRLARLPACSLCERAVIETRNPRVGQQALTTGATFFRRG